MKTIKTLYAIVNSKGEIYMSTISNSRSEAIKKKCSVPMGVDYIYWEHIKKKGFRCVKFEVTFNELKTNKDGKDDNNR